MIINKATFSTFLVLLLLPSDAKADLATTPTIAWPGYRDHCGNVSIPFPVGVGANCSLDPWFEIIRNTSNKPFLPGFHNFEVMETTIPGYDNQWLQSMDEGLRFLSSSGANHTKNPFKFSTNHSVSLMKGCPGSTLLTEQAINKPLTGCSTACYNGSESSPISSKKTYGVVSKCCQMELPQETSTLDHSGGIYYQISALQYYKIVFCGQSSGECLAATLIKIDSVEQHMSAVSKSSPDLNHGAYNRDSAWNSHVLNGCQQQDACKSCQYCTWEQKNSSYRCEFPDPTIGQFIVTSILAKLAIYFGIPLLLVLGCRWLFYAVKRRRKTERRVKNFKLKLQQHRSSNEGIGNKIKLFTNKALNKATDHFNENRILGKGGQGTVYKGMLTDGTTVAIKKSSKLEDERQMEQFINEVVILSTVNHRNVVKLLGCCLETEVPLLVYEFICNGTLSQNIHYPSEDFVLTWAMRLKIAADSARAVGYLHSSCSTPVYHKDIKPANILLDEKHRAKVSDFGSSKTIEIDQTHLTTVVQGTIGYLDPEYFESGIFTEKSDVYSFGVVLLELLTSKKPIYKDATMEQKALVVEFFLHEQSSNLLDLFDHEIAKEAKDEELIAVVNLAKHCLHGSGRLRPTMREVAMTLEMIIKSPAEMSTHEQQTSSSEGFNEVFMPEMSEIDFISSPVPPRISSPLYIDVHPLLHDTN